MSRGSNYRQGGQPRDRIVRKAHDLKAAALAELETRNPKPEVEGIELRKIKKKQK